MTTSRRKAKLIAIATILVAVGGGLIHALISIKPSPSRSSITAKFSPGSIDKISAEIAGDSIVVDATSPIGIETLEQIDDSLSSPADLSVPRLGIPEQMTLLGSDGFSITAIVYSNVIEIDGGIFHIDGDALTKPFDDKYSRLTYYYDNGSRRATGIHRAGQKDGFWRFFYPDGQPLADGYFKNGVKVGTWTDDSEDGTKVLTDLGVEKGGTTNLKTGHHQSRSARRLRIADSCALALFNSPAHSSGS